MLIETVVAAKKEKMADFPKDRLESLNKARTRGPNGRRLPSSKLKKKEHIEEEEERTSDSNDNLVNSTSALTDTSNLGTINPEDFDKIWFIRVPSIPGEIEDGADSPSADDDGQHNSKPNQSNARQSVQDGQFQSTRNAAKLSDSQCDKDLSKQNDCGGPQEGGVKVKKGRWKLPKQCNIL